MGRGGRAATSAIAALVAAALLGGAPAARSAAPPPGVPPPGRVLLGSQWDAGRRTFDRATRHHHALRMLFQGWGQGVDWGTPIGTVLASARARDVTLVVHLSTVRWRVGEVVTPKGVATGRGDAYLVALAQALNSSGQDVWVRPMAEMNGHWNAWCAFRADGSSKGPAYATAQYRRAFRRIAVIMRGGTEAGIDRTLRALRLPPLTVHADVPASGRIALVWNPQGRGAPDVRGNAPEDYYPGDRVVDLVADDLYEQGGGAVWDGMDALYAAHPTKRFVVAEWAPWGYDSPGFATRMVRWARTHRRTAALIWFGESGTIWDIRTMPQTLRVYRREAARPIFRS